MAPNLDQVNEDLRLLGEIAARYNPADFPQGSFVRRGAHVAWNNLKTAENSVLVVLRGLQQESQLTSL